MQETPFALTRDDWSCAPFPGACGCVLDSEADTKLGSLEQGEADARINLSLKIQNSEEITASR